jgi:hypothetical protein
LREYAQTNARLHAQLAALEDNNRADH